MTTDPKRELARELYLQGKKYQEIADEVGVSLSAVKSWATRYWRAEKLQPKKQKVATEVAKKVATKRHRGGQPGNHNATGPPGNQHAVKHGFFCKVLPAETLELVKDLEEMDPLNVLWQNIQIQYAAILRAQQIMFVIDSDDKTVEKIEEKSGNVIGERWEVQQAWDKQATFLSAQSRAMQTLTNMIKQYDAMVENGMANQEQKARIELLRAQVKKLQEDPENSKSSSKVVIVNDLEQINKSEDRQTE
ncbi:phage terminase small subunit [Holdemania massiliensis]|uniref:phage terminase small subunit n=1 Tax=Holdemania massiliensis TaxID=1468449 RepID=UPI0036F2A549